jgi:hypothetical protein
MPLRVSINPPTRLHRPLRFALLEKARLRIDTFALVPSVHSWYLEPTTTAADNATACVMVRASSCQSQARIDLNGEEPRWSIFTGYLYHGKTRAACAIERLFLANNHPVADGEEERGSYICWVTHEVQ